MWIQRSIGYTLLQVRALLLLRFILSVGRLVRMILECYWSLGVWRFMIVGNYILSTRIVFMCCVMFICCVNCRVLLRILVGCG